jgi:hypothetical protein
MDRKYYVVMEYPPFKLSIQNHTKVLCQSFQNVWDEDVNIYHAITENLSLEECKAFCKQKGFEDVDVF